jgi:hypothetical protein
MEGELAELMCELNPSFQMNEKGVLYLKCVKALYEHIEAARLFYNNLDERLMKKLEFKRNPYDPCVYNKQTSDGTVTVRTHVDDLKASSISTIQLEKLISDLRRIYGEITVHRGNEHDYLGMIMVYNKDQQSVEINMQIYFMGCLQEFEEEVTGTVFKTVNTPASEHLFKVRDKEILLLSSERKKIFHSTVAKLLLVAKRGRPDILLAISFLTTWVQAPDEDDWKKLL